MIQRVCLTRLRYVFRFSQPLDVFLPAYPRLDCFTRLAFPGLTPSKVCSLAPGSLVSQRVLTRLPLV